MAYYDEDEEEQKRRDLADEAGDTDDDEYGQSVTMKLDTVPGARRSTRLDDAHREAQDARHRATEYSRTASADIEASAKPSTGRRLLGAALGGLYGFAKASGNISSRMPDDGSFDAAIDRGVVRPGYYDKLRKHGERQKQLNREADLAQKDLEGEYRGAESEAKIATQHAQERSYEAREQGWKTRQAEAQAKLDRLKVEIPDPPKEAAQLPMWFRANAAKLQQHGYNTLDDYLKDTRSAHDALNPPKPEKPAVSRNRTAEDTLMDPSATPDQKAQAEKVLRMKHPPRQAGRQGRGVTEERYNDSKTVNEIAGSILKSGKTFEQALAAGDIPEGYEMQVKRQLESGNKGGGKGKGGGLDRLKAVLGGGKPDAFGGKPSGKTDTSKMSVEELMRMASGQ